MWKAKVRIEGGFIFHLESGDKAGIYGAVAACLRRMSRRYKYVHWYDVTSPKDVVTHEEPSYVDQKAAFPA